MSIFSNPKLNQHLKQVAKFSVSGVLGAIIEFSVIYVLIGRLGWSAYVVYIPSALIPAFFVFFFNKYVTFGASEGKTASQSGRFLLVYASTFCLNYLLSSSFYLAGDRLILDSVIGGIAITEVHIAYGAKFCAIGIVAVVNYVLSHTFIFKNTPVEAEVAGIF
ncbi:MAG: GtrA family protein [Candidatus Peribacteraceae bacterium]|nr:GtrA family protein [Candidatus Peribacteraceae bacterium]